MQVSSMKTHCARCGREFRGDWDRHATAHGLVCNICSNLVASQAQSLQSTGFVQPVDTLKLDPSDDPITRQPVEVEEVQEPWYQPYIPDKEMMRRITIGAAIAFGLYTIYLVISGAWIVDPAPEKANGIVQTATEAPPPAPELPVWAKVAVSILYTSSGFAGTLVGLYVFLMLSRRLPQETFLANLIHILPATAIITALLFAARILPFGAIPAFLFIPLVIFVTLGFEAQDILNLPIGMFIGGLLTFAFYTLLYGVIAAIAL